MAKYTKLEEPVFITKCFERSSQHGGDIWEIHLKGVKSRIDYKTYADPANLNWRVWEHIVQSAQDSGVVLSNVKLKDDGKGIVNADSQVKIEMVVLPEILAQEIGDYWDKLDAEQDTFRKFMRGAE